MINSKGKIVITGGTGFLGTSLAQSLWESRYNVCLISRTSPETQGHWTHVSWDAHSLGQWIHELDGATAIVNLAGRSVDCIKSPDNCDVILRSRVATTQLIGQAIRQIDSPPPTWIQMSTAHIYGDPPEATCTETSPFGYGLAPFVGQAWEKAYQEAALPDMRQVVFRTSFVLGRGGGALPRLAKLTRMGLGGKVGHGRQGMSWIHQEDLNRLFLRAIDNDNMKGVYVVSAPNPVSNAEFMRHLRKAMGIPIGLPALPWMVKLGAPLFMKTDPELALYGRYCISSRLEKEDFTFNYPNIYTALNQIFSRKQ